MQSERDAFSTEPCATYSTFQAAYLLKQQGRGDGRKVRVQSTRDKSLPQLCQAVSQALQSEYNFQASSRMDYGFNTNRNPMQSPIVRNVLPPPRVYPAVRSVIVESADLAEIPSLEKGSRTTLARLNTLSLTFSSNLQMLARSNQSRIAAHLSELWAKAMQGMVAAVEESGRRETRAGERVKALQRELEERRREAVKAEAESAHKDAEIKRLKAEQIELQQRWRVLVQHQPHLIDTELFRQTLWDDDMFQLKDGNGVASVHAGTPGASRRPSIRNVKDGARVALGEASLADLVGIPQQAAAEASQESITSPTTRLAVEPEEELLTNNEKQALATEVSQLINLPFLTNKDNHEQARRSGPRAMETSDKSIQADLGLEEQLLKQSMFSGHDPMTMHPEGVADASPPDTPNGPTSEPAPRSKIVVRHPRDRAEPTGLTTNPAGAPPIFTELNTVHRNVGRRRELDEAAREPMPLKILHEHILTILLEVIDLRPQIYRGELYCERDTQLRFQLRARRRSIMPVQSEQSRELVHEKSREVLGLPVRDLTAEEGGVDKEMWYLPPMSEFVTEWFMRAHGSQPLALRHLTDFAISMREHHTDSLLVHTFARICGQFTAIGPMAARFLFAVISRLINGHDPMEKWHFSASGVVMVPLEVSKEKIMLTFRQMDLVAPWSMIEALGEAAEAVHVNEEHTRLMVDFGQVLDLAVAAWYDHMVNSNEYITSFFCAKYPRGEILLHYDKFSELMRLLVPKCPSSAISKMFREASADAAKEPMHANLLTVQQFVHVAENNEVLGWNAVLADLSDPKSALERRLANRDYEGPDVNTAMSLKLLEYAWSSVNQTMSMWLKRWRNLKHASASGVGNTSQRRDKGIVVAGRLEKIIFEANEVLHESRLNVFTKGRGRSAAGDLDYAWKIYNRCVCDLEASVLDHRESIGINDFHVQNSAATLWG